MKLDLTQYEANAVPKVSDSYARIALLSLAKEQQETIRELAVALKRLADAAEDEMSNDIDMPNSEATTQECENAINVARALLAKASA